MKNGILNMAGIVLSIGIISCASIPKNASGDFSKLNAAIYSIDGKYLFTGNATKNAVVAKFDAATEKLIQKFDKVENNGIDQLILSSDGKQLLVDCINNEKYTVDYIFDVETGKMINAITPFGLYYVRDNNFHGIAMYCSWETGDVAITVKDILSDTVIKTMHIPGLFTNIKQVGLQSVSYTGNKYAFVGYEKESSPETWNLFIIDMTSEDQKPKVLTGRKEYLEYICSMAFSPDDKYIAVGTNEETKSREYTQKVAQSSQTRDIIESLSWEGSGWVMSQLYREGFIAVWLNRYGNGIEGYRWAREGRVSVYDLNDGEQLARLNCSGRTYLDEYRNYDRTQVKFINFTPDGKYFYGGSYNDFVGSLTSGKWKIENGTGVTQGEGKFLCFDPEGYVLIKWPRNKNISKRGKWRPWIPIP